MESYKYLVVGGGIAGQRACHGIRRVDQKGTMALVAREDHLPYQRPPLSKGYLLGKEGLDHVYLREEAYYAENEIEVLIGVGAKSIDRRAHSITLDDGRVLKYEKLLLATGGRAWSPPIAGNDLPGVFTLRTIEDSDGIRQAAKPGRQTLVIGGSFMASEVASSLAQLGLKVTMVFPSGRLLERVMPEEVGSFLHTKYESNGVRILAERRLRSLEGDGKAERALLEDGESLAVDLVVMGVGIRLNTELAREADLKLGEKNAVVVDEYLRTSDPDIYAAGDIALYPHPIFDKRLQVEHWDVARGQGLRAGGNMAGQERPYRDLPHFFSDVFDLSYEVWGDLSSWDRTVLQGTPEQGSFAVYYFALGRMVGVLAAGRSEEEHKQMQALVTARLAYEKVADKLRDERVDLSTLLK